MEIWRQIIGYETLYEVSSLGRIRNKHGRIVKSVTSKANQRPAVTLSKNRTPVKRHVHSLVLAAFVGPKPHGKECCHYDGNCKNNALSNLRWDTHSANIADKVRHGTFQYGEKSPSAKLTATHVNAIKADSRPQKLIAQEYGVIQSTISRIKTGKRWAHS